MLTKAERQEGRANWQRIAAEAIGTPQEKAVQHTAEVIFLLLDDLDAKDEEIASLRADAHEWICASCNHVYPGPPQDGLSCVVCPRCGGDTMPKSSYEIRKRDAEITTLRAELSDAEATVELFANCSERAHKMWKAAHPEIDYWPDGAQNIVWLLEQLHEAKTENARVNTLNTQQARRMRHLTVLAVGCSQHSSYRAKRKITTFCKTCNLMWDASQALKEMATANQIVADVGLKRFLDQAIKSYDVKKVTAELDEFFAGPDEEEKSGG